MFRASGVSQTKARQQFGLQNMYERSAHVEACISEAKEIKSAVSELAMLQDQAILDCYCGGSSPEPLACLSESDTESDATEEENLCSCESDCESYCISLMIELPNEQALLHLLCECEYNWFQFIEQVEFSSDLNTDLLENFFYSLPNLGLSPSSMNLVVQSHRAFNATIVDLQEQERTARSMNGEIVSDSDCELTPEVDESMAVKDKIRKKQVAVQRCAKRLEAKLIAEKRFLQRKRGKRTSKIIQTCTDIGDVIEEFVKDHSVGADAWRRTGILTFDGNANIKDKVTYKKIQAHLEKVYSRKFAYGTVVELCVARNKRRRSSKRYRGLAKVTTRRARKGFSLRFNPDSHWSASFYKELNKLEYIDGRNILNVNRDDATGFRLDTLTTCKQHANPVVQGQDILTTRTDYVNKYPSIIQTTSYNFTHTNTTGEVCVGVVKAPPVHCKNPAQHYSDLQMLSQMEDLIPVFHNLETNSPKEIDCIRVDGASDEGPAHEVVQYYWTEWHINHGKTVTLVTSRCSGSSYLNRVELQNGCLSLGHSNTFIPSTLGGSCIDPHTGKVDQTKLKENLNLAITAYISRVDGCSCGETNTKLVRGSNSDPIQEVNNNLLTYLKGSKKSKDVLKAEMPALYKHFDEVWKIRNQHMVRDLPQSYIFFSEMLLPAWLCTS